MDSVTTLMTSHHTGRDCRQQLTVNPVTTLIASHHTGEGGGVGSLTGRMRWCGWTARPHPWCAARAVLGLGQTEWWTAHK
jgi:hypothetical protein